MRLVRFYGLLLLGMSSGVRSFVPSAVVRVRSCNLHRQGSSGSHVSGAGSTSIMMAGFGAKGKGAPRQQGAGKGQRAYERQIVAFRGLTNAGAEVVDVYVYQTETDDDKFIFAGKVARSSGISVEQALQWQRTLIVDHIMILEPRARSPMRIFTAPANTELEVARNAQDLTWVLGGKGSVDTGGMKSVEVGYVPELYEKGEQYFYVRKNPDGTSKTPPQEVQMDSYENMVKSGMIPPPGASPPGEGAGTETTAALTDGA